MNPCRGEIWLCSLDPAVGHEQGGRRPCLVVSADELNNSPADLVIVLPVTSRGKNIPTRVAAVPPEGGLNLPSFIQCEMVRSISKRRLSKRLGSIASGTMENIEKELRLLFDL